MIGKKYDKSVKTVIVGDSGVGKTCILTRFVSGTFETDTSSTLGVEFMSKIVETQSRKIELQLWDTAGQELFRAVTKAYYRGSVGAFLVFDVTKRESFTNIARWLSDVRSTANAEAVCVLLANKCDLEEMREVRTEEAKEFAEENGLRLFEVSAKTGENIEEAMMECVGAIERLIDEGKCDCTFGNDQIEITDDDNKKNESSCC